MDRDTKCFHERSRVLTEPLLARYQRVAMVMVLHLALREIVREPDVVVGRQQQAGALPL